MNNFLILGLPRSRTAWLANFMTTDDIFCSHEGLNGCHTLQEYKNKFKPNSGDSNTGLALFDFENQFKEFKIVVIENTIDASVNFSLDNYGVDITEVMTVLQERLLSLRGLHIPFQDINDRLEEIWNYLTPKQFNESRTEMLINFDVQIRDLSLMDQKAMMILRENTNAYF